MSNDQQDYLRLVMVRFGFNRNELAARLRISRRGLDKWLLPSNSSDFRKMPKIARALLDELCAANAQSRGPAAMGGTASPVLCTEPASGLGPEGGAAGPSAAPTPEGVGFAPPSGRQPL